MTNGKITFQPVEVIISVYCLYNKRIIDICCDDLIPACGAPALVAGCRGFCVWGWSMRRNNRSVRNAAKAIVELLESRRMLAAQLVADIQTGTDPSYPTDLVVAGEWLS